MPTPLDPLDVSRLAFHLDQALQAIRALGIDLRDPALEGAWSTAQGSLAFKLFSLRLLGLPLPKVTGADLVVDPQATTSVPELLAVLANSWSGYLSSLPPKG